MVFGGEMNMSFDLEVEPKNFPQRDAKVHIRNILDKDSDKIAKANIKVN